MLVLGWGAEGYRAAEESSDSFDKDIRDAVEELGNNLHLQEEAEAWRSCTEIKKFVGIARA